MRRVYCYVLCGEPGFHAHPLRRTAWKPGRASRWFFTGSPGVEPNSPDLTLRRVGRTDPLVALEDGESLPVHGSVLACESPFHGFLQAGEMFLYRFFLYLSSLFRWVTLYGQ